MTIWTGFWAERAGKAEADSDHMADFIARVRPHLSNTDFRRAEDLLRDWREHREARYAALPAGPTQIGNYASGGIR